MYHFIGGQAKNDPRQLLGIYDGHGSLALVGPTLYSLVFWPFFRQMCNRANCCRPLLFPPHKRKSRPYCVNIGAVMIQESAILWVHHPSKMDVAVHVPLWEWRTHGIFGQMDRKMDSMPIIIVYPKRTTTTSASPRWWTSSVQAHINTVYWMIIILQCQNMTQSGGVIELQVCTCQIQ